jgi:hypothetical protein
MPWYWRRRRPQQTEKRDMAKKPDATGELLPTTAQGDVITTNLGALEDEAANARVATTSTTTTATTTASAGKVLGRLLVAHAVGGLVLPGNTVIELDPAEAKSLEAQGVLDTDPAAVAYVNSSATIQPDF